MNKERHISNLREAYADWLSAEDETIFAPDGNFVATLSNKNLLTANLTDAFFDYIGITHCTVCKQPTLNLQTSAFENQKRAWCINISGFLDHQSLGRMPEVVSPNNAALMIEAACSTCGHIMHFHKSIILEQIQHILDTGKNEG